jgi:hypothetical protein
MPTPTTSEESAMLKLGHSLVPKFFTRKPSDRRRVGVHPDEVGDVGLAHPIDGVAQRAREDQAERRLTMYQSARGQLAEHVGDHVEREQREDPEHHVPVAEAPEDAERSARVLGVHDRQEPRDHRDLLHVPYVDIRHDPRLARLVQQEAHRGDPGEDGVATVQQFHEGDVARSPC